MKTLTYTAKLSRPTHIRLSAFLRQQKDLWNAALQERIEAYQKAGKSITAFDQMKSLTEIRQDSEFSQYHLHSQRTALRRLDGAFQSFFRRVKRGESPGFPRFRSRCRSFETGAFKIHTKGDWHSVSVKGVGRFRFKGELPDTAKLLRVVVTPQRVNIQLAGEVAEDYRPLDEPSSGLTWVLSRWWLRARVS